MNNYSGGIYAIRIDESDYDFHEGDEKIIIKDNQIVTIKDMEWLNIKNSLKNNSSSKGKTIHCDKKSKKIKENKRYRKTGH